MRIRNARLGHQSRGNSCNLCLNCFTRKKFLNWWVYAWKFIVSWEKGHDEVIYKDALVVELNRAGIPFSREKNYEITYKGVILPHYYYADFVVWQKILFEAKAVEKLTDSHIKQVLNYLAASNLRIGLLVNFGGDVVEWERVIL